jgi:hypothetical protein
VFLHGGGTNFHLEPFLSTVADAPPGPIVALMQAPYPDGTPNKAVELQISACIQTVRSALLASGREIIIVRTTHDATTARQGTAEDANAAMYDVASANNPLMQAAAIVGWGGRTLDLAHLRGSKLGSSLVARIDAGTPFYGISAFSKPLFAYSQFVRRVDGQPFGTVTRGSVADNFQGDAALAPGLGVVGIANDRVVIPHVIEERSRTDPTRGYDQGVDGFVAMLMDRSINSSLGLVAGAQVRLDGARLENITVLNEGVYLYKRANIPAAVSGGPVGGAAGFALANQQSAEVQANPGNLGVVLLPLGTHAKQW